MKPLYKLLAASAFAVLATASVSAQDAGADAPYKVVEGNKVDADTLKGWKTWRALACERCHGAQQEGLVGPSLVESLKRLTKTEFQTTVMNGRIEKGMPNFSGSQQMVDNWQNLYAYLKGRSDGKIQPGNLKPMDPQ
ncbi:c-type cytochrome [Derxia lacustris]|uniref:c-type cytochrome n=1 Tax=Derxia lacustris TaxID=764842 RepID=UPI000A170DCE|nr:c-type cytochrome [Derxia lacustris]